MNGYPAKTADGRIYRIVRSWTPNPARPEETLLRSGKEEIWRLDVNGRIESVAQGVLPYTLRNDEGHEVCIVREWSLLSILVDDEGCLWQRTHDGIAPAENLNPLFD